MMSLNKKIKDVVDEDLLNRNALERILDMFEKNLDQVGFELIGTEFKNGEPLYLVKVKHR
jgi:hypothetical protein